MLKGYTVSFKLSDDYTIERVSAYVGFEKIDANTGKKRRVNYTLAGNEYLFENELRLIK